MKKGFINILETIIVIIVLFVAFGILFPGFTYRGRWGDALVILKGRDLIVTMDRTGQLYNYSFNFENLQAFLDTLIPTNETGLLPWSETEGIIKSTIWIACNCTDQEIINVTSWTKGLRINDRDIDFIPCYTNLDSINPCLRSSDVLFIFGYENLSNFAVRNTLKEYLKTGSGIVEMADLTVEQLVGDDGQKEIFGLNTAQSDGFDPNKYPTHDLFPRMPDNATDIIYGPWKYFYRVPIPVYTTRTVSSIPSDRSVTPRACTTIKAGNFSIQANITGESTGETFNYPFWICDSQYVYFDTDQIPNQSADVELQKNDKFYIRNFYDSARNWTFRLNYVDQDRIHVSFRPRYEFHDFIKYDFGCVAIDQPGKGNAGGEGLNLGWCKGNKAWVGVNMLSPALNDRYKILLQADLLTKIKDEPVPAVLLNGTSYSHATWIANFTEEGVGDDERLLLISLLLWASNKRGVSTISPELRRGFKISYVNTVNMDMYEVYKFSLGLGYPF